MKKTLFTLPILCLGYLGYSQTVLDFSFDASGNQTLRKGSSESFRTTTVVSDSIVSPFSESLIETIENKFTVSPNPTSGVATLSWEAEFTEQIMNIEIISLLTSEKTSISRIKGNSVNIDLSGKITGVYVATFYLNNDIVQTVQKKIIKY